MNIYIILLISILGPIIGSLIGVLKKPSHFFINNMLSFAAGVMLAISFLNLIPKAVSLSGILFATFGILLGAIFMYFMDITIPHIHSKSCHHESKLEAASLFLIMGIFMHNLPEGMAIATGTISGYGATVAIALAISVHNIPEGICTSAPYYYCSRKRLKSFLISASTVIPLIVGFFFAKFLFSFISILLSGVIVAATAGVMIYISADELIPYSIQQDSKWFSHSTIFSLIFGVIFVAMLGYI